MKCFISYFFVAIIVVNTSIYAQYHSSGSSLESFSKVDIPEQYSHLFKSVNMKQQLSPYFNNFAPKNGDLAFSDGDNLLANDTLFKYLNRSSKLTVYAVKDNNDNQWPLTGTNLLYDFLGSYYNFTSGNSYIPGFLVAYNAYLLNESYDSLLVFVLTVDNTGNPVKIVGAEIILGSRITTKEGEIVFSVIKFKQPIAVNTNFTVYVQTFGMDPSSDAGKTDIQALYSNTDGEGNNENTIRLGKFENDQLLVESKLSSIVSNPPDIDLMLLPIISNTSDVFSIEDFKSCQLSQNPVYDKAYFSFNLESDSYTEINIYTLDGKFIKKIHEGMLLSGSNSILFDLQDLYPGCYLFTLQTPKTKFGGTLIKN